MTQSVIELQNIKKTYQQGAVEVQALRGLDLTIAPGEFTAICGPSGSGKSTALNIIGGLDVPTSGVVKVAGTDLSSMSRRALSELRRDKIGFVFQAYNLIPVLSAFENAEAVLALQGRSAEERTKRVYELLEEVGLKGMEDRRPDQLSGGQQQRVAIARAIAPEPAVVLADEPTANVDSETATKLLDLMERLNKARGATFVFSTHDPRVMERASRIVYLVDGVVDHDERKTNGGAV